MLHHFIYILILFLVQHTTEQYLLGTHFYVNQENILIDNTLKTVSTLARPYDLVAFIGQSERLARIDHLQTYIDAVDDADELTPQQQSDKLDSDTQENNENINKCYHFMDNGESLIFKILKTNLYDTFYIPFELKNISNNCSVNEKSKTKILTCTHFCQARTSLVTFDNLPSISTRYDEQQAIRIDDEEINSQATANYDKQAIWSINELNKNRTSSLAYVYLSRYFHSNFSYDNAIDCLRCALIYGSNNDDIVLTELANIVFRYGYIRDAIIFIQRALDFHLKSQTTNVTSLFIRSILHYYLGNLCTIDNRFVLAIQFYNRTKILLERITKMSDDQQLEILSSTSLASLSMPSLLSISKEKLDALGCHLTLESSLQRKHHLLQTKLAQLNQLRSITDELIQLNNLIKRDMSNGQSFIDYLRQLKEEKKQIICDWKKTRKRKFISDNISNYLFSYRKKYSTIMKQEDYCRTNDDYSFITKTINNTITDNYDCRPRDNFIIIDEEIDMKDESSLNRKQHLMSLRIATIERTQSTYSLDDNYRPSDSMGASDRITLASTASSPTLTSRLPTEISIEPKYFSFKQANELYPPLKQNIAIKINEQQLPTYKDCQIHYRGLPSIGDYPTVWLPLENKGLLNVKQAFYEGLNHQYRHYPLPWSPPLCTLHKPIDERLSIIDNHSVLKRSSRAKAPTNRYDTNMLLNLYLYIDSIIDEQRPIEEFGQRLRSVEEKHQQLLPEWIVHLLSSLYWRIRGHLPHAIDCGLQAHQLIIRDKVYKKWSDLTLVNLANILYLWGKYEDALDLTEQAHAINSHEPITNYLLGNLLALTKHNHTAAQEYYRRTLTVDPTNIYARRQLRLSYCYTMHTAWEMMSYSNDKMNYNKKSSPPIESMNHNLMLSNQNYNPHENAMSISNSATCMSYSHQNAQCHQSLVDNRSSIDRWLNRSCSISSIKRVELLDGARRAYRSYGLCSSSSAAEINNNHMNDECSQGYAVTNNGNDIGHIIIIYDHVKHTFDYTLIFTNDYKTMFSTESKLKCMIYGTGRKSSKCHDFNLIDPNELNPKHNMTWWRDPSTLYEHLKELIEIINYENELNNKTQLNHNNDSFYEKYVSDNYILTKDIQEKYLLKNDIHFKEIDCLNKSTVTYTPYLSTWISPQTKNIYFNYTFFKQINKETVEFNQPICSYPIIESINTTKTIQIIDYIIKKANENLTLYRSEGILKPILLNLLFEKNPTIMNKGGDDKALIGSFLAAGLNLPVYNSSWLYFHTISLYWRLMGNASQTLNCLFQSYILSPANVQDFAYLSMALMLYNSQLHINEAIYLLYESLSIDPNALLLAHFTLGNSMARKGHFDFAEQWYQSTLKLKPDFEPAKSRLRAIQC
ncbi:unnamed protein product [Rotaria magnacalcarata]|uniref:Tetratricopeptide repeat protein n=2 Tax=Rotaria magnacalcarata TaxID=392030 RepID=A0A817AIL4_9BILA|nr:unnamed protein product [Rotaria magnacalcarata]